MTTMLFCEDKNRRDLVLQNTSNLNGIDYLEVIGTPGCGTQLALTFLKNPSGLGLTAANIQLIGDAALTILSVQPAADPLTITIKLAETGDFSRYWLTLVTSAQNPDPPTNIDPQLASVGFSFKAGCPTPVDCLPSDCCPQTPLAPPDIHYLARDYDGFRQAMLDRMAVLLTTWDETHPADIGVTIVETLAYAADRVSYMQDAVNTEAYIGTARSRISLRRHARLVDYLISEGSNARAWVCLTTNADAVVVPVQTQIYPLVVGLGPAVNPDSYAAATLQASPGPVFESMEACTLYVEQNQMAFYTWSGDQCCLPVGATSATLDGAFNTLSVGQVLIFEETIGPLTGDPSDADPTHRWAVRLTVATTVNDSNAALIDPLNGALLTHIEWAAADALPFPLCLSSITDSAHGSMPIAGVSVARGNLFATDQGTWTDGESLDQVPPMPLGPVTGIGCNCASMTPGISGAAVVRPRYEPALANQPLTFALAYKNTAPASTFLATPTTSGVPQVWLVSGDGAKWIAKEDLLEEDSSFNGFIPEIDTNGVANLRFGDGVYGASPDPGLSFTATYRTGNGTAGNVGRDSLAHVLLNQPSIVRVRNPLAAAGGVDPETPLHIQQYAPFSFQTQLRCVTAADYTAMAETLPGVERALGTLRWTGSWYTAFVSVEPVATWSYALRKSIKKSLNQMRMMGTDLKVEQADMVGLAIGLTICVAPGYFQGDVYAALWQVLVTGDSCAGTPGLLSSENFQFGATVYASPIIAAAQGVAGVLSVQLTTFARQESLPPQGTPTPVSLQMGPLEIPCCKNDPNNLDLGFLTLTLDGGK
jgi:hypothetical protein